MPAPRLGNAAEHVQRAPNGVGRVTLALHRGEEAGDVIDGDFGESLTTERRNEMPAESAPVELDRRLAEPTTSSSLAKNRALSRGNGVPERARNRHAEHLSRRGGGRGDRGGHSVLLGGRLPA